jgi:hypothetical protein
MSYLRGNRMNNWLKSAIICTLLAAPALAADQGPTKGPEVDLVDNMLSINAQTIPLGRLMRLVDMATGMKSKVPPELTNRNISVRFSGLSLTDGVRKIFQGQPFDYVLIEGQGVVVTASSQTVTGTESVPAYNSSPQPEQPFVQDFNGQFQPPPPIAGQQQQQPATIQTPFGPVANPRAPQPQQPNAPLSAPGQQNSLFPNTGQQNNTAQPVVPTVPGQIGTPTPFGTPNPFGMPAQPQQNLQNPQIQQQNNPNSLFGNPFSTPGTQQR